MRGVVLSGEGEEVLAVVDHLNDVPWTDYGEDFFGDLSHLERTCILCRQHSSVAHATTRLYPTCKIQ